MKPVAAKPVPQEKRKEPKKPVAAVADGSTTDGNKYLKYLINFWIFIPAVVYFNMVSVYALNIPMQDDYDAILKFLTDWVMTPSFTDRFFMLFTQHGDHRILHSRLLYVWYYDLFGKVNLRNIIFISNIQLLVAYVVLVHFIKKAIPKYWNVVSLVAGFCIFDPSSYENATFAMCGLVNYGVIMFFMISLYFFTRPGNRNLVIALVSQFFCIFASGGGVMSALCLPVFLLLSKDKRRAIYSGALLVIGTALYYTHYTKGSDPAELHDPFSLMRIVRFLLHMMGSHFSFENGILAGVCVLLVLVLTFPLDIKKLQIKENTLPLICVLAAVGATTLSIAVFRSDYTAGEVASYWSRYLIYSHMLAALAFVFLWILFMGKKVLWPVMGVATLCLLYAYKDNYAYGEGCMAMIQRRMQNRPYYYPDAAKAKEIESHACRLGIYCIQDER